MLFNSFSFAVFMPGSMAWRGLRAFLAAFFFAFSLRLAVAVFFGFGSFGSSVFGSLSACVAIAK